MTAEAAAWAGDGVVATATGTGRHSGPDLTGSHLNGRVQAAEQVIGAVRAPHGS